MLVMMLLHRDARGALPLVLVAHHGVGRRSLHRQTLVEPGQRRRDARILIAQPVHELDRKGVRQRQPVRSAASTAGTGSAACPPRPAGGRRDCPPPAVRRATVHDPLRQPPEVLDQHDPQRDGDRPELADRQRLDLLVGAHVAAQHLGIEAAVGVGDESPGDTEHPRISGERSVRELGQLPVIAGGRSERISRICLSTT